MPILIKVIWSKIKNFQIEILHSILLPTFDEKAQATTHYQLTLNPIHTEKEVSFEIQY